jgi:signal transduction histidine kinase
VESLDIQATARSGDVEVRLQRGSAVSGLADWLVVALFLTGLAAAAAVVWGFASAVARRLRHQAANLAASAEAVASGDLTVRADVPADELGRAAGAFNRMTERLAEADARQRRFLADVAHELRTPVTAIDGFATALVDGAASTPEAREEAVRFIRDEATRLRELIGDLRELTRLDLDPAPVVERFDLAQAARDAVGRFTQSAADARVTLTGPQGSLPFETDPGSVETILANLIQNALAATPAAGHVSVGVRGEGESALLTVADTGIGIAGEHLTHIFDRLYRIDDARSREQGGSGLGLAIVKKLIASLGGTIAVESAPGDGTTFTLRIPAISTPAMPAPVIRSDTPG